MPKSVFLNYRRDDSPGSAGRLFDLLSQHLKGVRIFMDVDSLEPGVDFAGSLENQLAACDFFLAVIGPEWAEIKGPDGRRRLDNPEDYVRMEIETALRRDVRVVPVLVDGAKMPSPKDLPPSLQAFARRNAFEVSHHKFASDVAELSRFMLRNLGIHDAIQPAEPQSRSWADILLSFRGRISRKQFWIWSTALLPITVILQHLLLLVVGGSMMDFFTKPPEQIPVQHHLLTQIGTLPIWWCIFALAAKRLHDFNAGWGFTAALLITTALYMALYFADVSMATDPELRETKEFATIQGLFIGFTVLYLVVWFGVGLIPGTPGPNRYGPEPGARSRAAAA